MKIRETHFVTICLFLLFAGGVSLSVLGILLWTPVTPAWAENSDNASYRGAVNETTQINPDALKLRSLEPIDRPQPELEKPLTEPGGADADGYRGPQPACYWQWCYTTAAYFWRLPDAWGDVAQAQKFTTGIFNACRIEDVRWYLHASPNPVAYTHQSKVSVYSDAGGLPGVELASILIGPGTAIPYVFYPAPTCVDFTSFNIVVTSDFWVAIESFAPDSASGIRTLSDDVDIGGGGCFDSWAEYYGMWGLMWQDWGFPAQDAAALVDVYKCQVDPDPNDATNWLLCETGDARIGPPDIRPLWNRFTVGSLSAAWCPAAPHWCHFWISPADWAGDFKGAAAGGAENSHVWGYTGMDYHDLSVIACHGSPGRIFFTTGPPPANNVLTPANIVGVWGNRDAEWFCALSCSPYAWNPPNNWPWQWARAFNGLHLQCGFTTIAWFTNGRFLGGFAWLMDGQWPWKPAFPIAPSWFLARALWQGPGTCVIALADDWRAYLDRLWGEGWVSPDPAPPGGIVWAIWDPPLSEEESRTTAYPPPLSSKQREAISKIISGPASKTIPARSSLGMPVQTTQDLYTSKMPRQDMTVYHLVPLPIDSSFISDVADDFCANYGFLCAPDIGQDDEGNWWATEDEFALWGDPQSGIVQFVNIDEYVAKKDVPPTLPSPPSALTQSQNLLGDLGLMPPGSYSTGHTYNIQTAYDLDAEEIVPDSSFDLSINTEFSRIVDGYPVFGPGGYITVTFGDEYESQHFTRGGWHQLTSPSVEPIIDVSDAIDLLTTMGEDATIGGIPPICDTLLIDSVELAYYNTNGEYETDILEPIYHFCCYAASSYDTVPCDVYVPALTSTLQGSIIQPSHGSSFTQGTPITFEGYAMGGTTPYEYDWYSDVDGYLGSGNPIVVDDLSIVYKDTAVIAHSITLTVTDAASKSKSVNISVTITPGCCIDDRGNVDGDPNDQVNISDLTYLVDYLFRSGPAPPCWEEGNVDGDVNEQINIADLTYLVDFLFRGGPPPPPCP